MKTNPCLWSVCFEPLRTTAPAIFSFSDYLTAVALLVVAWTVVDFRYRFRVATTPLPLQRIAFGVGTSVGFLTLLTDLWRAEGWLVPRGNLVSPSQWQALLAGLFLAAFVSWFWFAFFRPAKYGRATAARYARSLYSVVVKSDPHELAVVAEELGRSVANLVRQASPHRSRNAPADPDEADRRANVTAYADDILLLLGDKRFCKVVVASCPAFAGQVLKEAAESGNCPQNLRTFARNITEAALLNKDSFVYHEAEGYDSGLIGYLKPVSEAFYGNYQLVETLGIALDVDYKCRALLDHDQWQAYCRVVSMTLSDYASRGCPDHSFALARAIADIHDAVRDLYKLDGHSEGAWEQGAWRNLDVVVDFIRDSMKILDDHNIGANHHAKDRNSYGTIHDRFADLIGEIVVSAAQVRGPRDLCWGIQHNTVWYRIFDKADAGPATRAIQRKAQRQIWTEIQAMEKFPNYKGAKLLGLCLNVMGLVVRGGDRYESSRPLQRIVLRWTRKNFARIYAADRRVAEKCLVEGFSYESKRLRIVKTYPPTLGRPQTRQYFNIDPFVPAHDPPN